VPQTRFEWDEAKNEANQRKHGVSFEQAVLAFNDPAVVSYKDRVEGGEERWKTLGMVEGLLLLLLVAHTVNHADSEEEVIRIISAREPSRAERRLYEEENS
jgi:uncharacterized DUF497 family protein